MSAVENRSGNRNVRLWIGTLFDDALFVSVITVMEAREGFARLRARADGARRKEEIAASEMDFDILLAAFADRVLPLDRRWRIVGVICSRCVKPTSWTLPWPRRPQCMGLSWPLAIFGMSGRGASGSSIPSEPMQ